MQRLGIWSLLGCLILSLVNFGCVDWVTIRPSDLPRLNGSNAARLPTADGTVLAIRQTTVRTPTGQTVEINGDFDARISSGGDARTFRGPIITEITGSRLVIHSSNQAPTSAPLSSINSVEVSQPSPGKSALLGVGVALFVGAFALGIGLGLM